MTRPEPVRFAITALLASPRHRYDGRPADGPGPVPGPETPDAVAVRAHKGLVGDRYFGSRHRYAAVTFLAEESLERLATRLGTAALDPLAARRNVVTRGLDVEDLLHTEFTLAGADGAPLRFRCLTRANPCAWMNDVLASGAHQAMRGDAGIRTEPLDDGVLALGPATLLATRRLDPDEVSSLRRSALRSAGY